MEKMDWARLLSRQRLGIDEYPENPDRPIFQRDFDRIIFSSAFRRLQDKTQVFPLAESDYVRTRLTHSLETSCVGRSLGSMVGQQIIDTHNLDFHPSDISTIVSAACLAHDIGNPPLGHSGEDAIRQWFEDSEIGTSLIKELEEEQQNDFKCFEGNAQGFRVLVRLQEPDNNGGMQLTYSTLAAYTKYPRESCIACDRKTKWGFFQQDKDFFSAIASKVGLIRRPQKNAWTRHPLAFLVEAADDITYRIIDFEDGYRIGHISYQYVYEHLNQIIKDRKVEEKIERITDEKDKVEYLRAKAINKLIEEVVDCFMANENSILDGTFDEDLISHTLSKKPLDEIKKLSETKAYSSRKVIEIESAGFQVLGGLLSAFVGAVDDVARNGTRASARSKKLMQLIPDQFLGIERCPDKNLYDRLIKITDFVSGMTDSYAVSLYKKISGISIPQA